MSTKPNPCPSTSTITHTTTGSRQNPLKADRLTAQEVARSIFTEIIYTAIDKAPRTKQTKKLAFRPSSFSVFRPPLQQFPGLTEQSEIIFANILVEAHAENKLGPLPEVKKKMLETKLKRLLPTLTLPKLLTLAKLIVNYNFSSSYPLFEDVFFHIKKNCPQLRKYFDVHGEHIVSLDAMDFYLKHQKTWEQGLVSCATFPDVSRIIEELSLMPPESYKGLVVRCDGSEHLLPIFLKKDRQGRLLLAITDSLGRGTMQATDEGETNVSKLIRHLTASFLKNEDSLLIFSYNAQRQNDSYSCPAFSLLDLKNMIRREKGGDSVFDFLLSDELEKTREPLGEKVAFQLFSFTSLPPDMMEITQSISGLNHYREIMSSSPLLRRCSPSPSPSSSPVAASSPLPPKCAAAGSDVPANGDEYLPSPSPVGHTVLFSFRERAYSPTSPSSKSPSPPFRPIPLGQNRAEAFQVLDDLTSRVSEEIYYSDAGKPLNKYVEKQLCALQFNMLTMLLTSFGVQWI